MTAIVINNWNTSRSSGVTFPISEYGGYGNFGDLGRYRMTSQTSQTSRYMPPVVDTSIWIDVVWSITGKTASRPITKFSMLEITERFEPRTQLGKRLFALRRKAIQDGIKLLTEDEILEEIRRRRGEAAGE